MSRFYYRPVDPGYDQFGAGLGYGLERGVTGYLEERDRKAERKLRDDEAERRRIAQETDIAMQQLQTDLFLAERGGGRGEPPRPAGTTDLDFGKPGLAQLGSGHPLTSPIDLGVGPPGPGPVARAAADPDFGRHMPVGPEGFGYIERPEWQQRRAQEDAEREAQLRMTGIAQSLVGSGRAANMDEAMAQARLMEQGGFQPIDLFQRPGTRWQPGSLEEEAALADVRAGAQARHRAPPTTPGAPAEGPAHPTMTMGQALSFVDEMYPAMIWSDEERGWINNPEAPSSQERLDLARQLASGQDVDLGRHPGAPGAPGEFDALLSMGQDIWGEARERARTGATPRMGPVGGPGEAPTPGERPTLSPEEIEGYRKDIAEHGWDINNPDKPDVSGMTLRELLQNAGFDEEMINAILGQ